MVPARTRTARAKSLLVGSEPALPRFFRLYEKKRGHRRTGSQAFGNLGEALFFGIFLAVGCAALAFMLVALVWPEWRANRQFVATTCVVLDKRVGDRPATENEPAMYRPEFRIRYQVDDQESRRGRRLRRHDSCIRPTRRRRRPWSIEFEVGQEYPCWYDPIDPHRAVVLRGLQRLAVRVAADPAVVHRHRRRAADLHAAALERLGRAAGGWRATGGADRPVRDALAATANFRPCRRTPT